MAPQVEGITHRPDGADTAFLLIHGFGAAPDEMASLGTFLSENGIASISIRLAGHDTTPEDWATSTYQDWYNSAYEGLEIVKSWKPKTLLLSGLSMGGILTLLLACREKGIDGIIVFSPAFKISRTAKLVPLLKHVKKYRNIDLSYIPKMYDMPRAKYSREPLSAIHELVKLTKVIRNEISNVEVPALIIGASADKTIDPENAAIVFNLISSDIKEIQMIDGAEHVITCHPSRHQAYPFILEFVDKIKSGNV
ncbi:MAG: alpha/beta hydrolase [Candidatus Thorarchaeota archaeon]